MSNCIYKCGSVEGSGQYRGPSGDRPILQKRGKSDHEAIDKGRDDDDGEHAESAVKAKSMMDGGKETKGKGKDVGC